MAQLLCNDMVSQFGTDTDIQPGCWYIYIVISFFNRIWMYIYICRVKVLSKNHVLSKPALYIYIRLLYYIMFYEIYKQNLRYIT